MNDKPSAFLIMPFDDEFNDVYERFMKPVLEKVGFNVSRADDIQSQQNILRDVLERIDSSDLIVADLTTSNPNVFYELGLTHAFRKPVILVTQSIDDVPFDLKPYRLLEYSAHFVKIEEGKKQLAKYAKGFLEGNVKFGSPVTDFRQAGAEPNVATDAVISNTVIGDERGFIDHLIAINDGYDRKTQITEEVTSDLKAMTQSIETATTELKQINTNTSASSPAAARNMSRRLAQGIGKFNSRLKLANAEYASIAQETEDSLEFVVSFQLEQSNVAAPEVVKRISLLRRVRCSLTTGRDSSLQLAKTMDGIPRFERRLNREVVRASDEIRVMARNLDKTIGSISRALAKYA